MGIDVEIRVYAEPTEDLLAKLRALTPRDATMNGHSHPILMAVGVECTKWNVNPEFDDKPYIVISSMARYFGPGYARGNWPDIKDALFAVREVCPPGTVWYGGDYRVSHDPTDDRLFAELDAVWESGERY